MRFDRGKLIFLGLAVLERARGRLRDGAFKPGEDVRLALAVLHGLSKSGDRARFDAFWRNLSDPFARAYSDVDAKSRRMSEAHRLFEGIATDVGAPGDLAE